MREEKENAVIKKNKSTSIISMTSESITRLYTFARDVCMNFRVSHADRYCYLPIFTLVCGDITSRNLLCNIKEKLLKLYTNIMCRYI